MWFISYAIRSNYRPESIWSFGNKTIDVHPIKWLKEQKKDKGWETVLLFYAELKELGD